MDAKQIQETDTKLLKGFYTFKYTNITNKFTSNYAYQIMTSPPPW